MSQSILSVLVVDDEYLIAMDAERILTDALPCEVKIASRRFCQEALSRKQFDIIVLDIDPFQDDLQPLAGIRSRETGVILSSTLVGFGRRTQLGPRTATVCKPYHDGQFREAIAHVLSPGRTILPAAIQRSPADRNSDAAFVKGSDRSAGVGRAPVAQASVH